MQDRILKIQNLMINSDIDGLLVSSVPNITYLTGFSSFSKNEREAFILILKDNQYILTDGRYSGAVRRDVKNFKLIEISSSLSFAKALKEIINKQKIKRLGFEGDNLTFLEHKKLLSRFNDLNHFSLNNLRAIKDEEEISKIEKACEVGDKTFAYILKKIKEGVSEKEIAFAIEFFIKKQDADISFPPIVAFGKNSSVPHHVPTNNQLTNNQIVLLDFGVKLNNYCSDMTRAVFFGSATKEFKKMYQTVFEAQKLAIESLTSDGGRLSLRSHDSSEVDRIARDYIISKGYKTIPHSVGHGIGLEVHESPRLSPLSKDILKENMVFSIEPGIYLPGFGGVRIEDLVVLEKSSLPRHKAGPKLLTKSPKQLIELT